MSGPPQHPATANPRTRRQRGPRQSRISYSRRNSFSFCVLTLRSSDINQLVICQFSLPAGMANRSGRIVLNIVARYRHPRCRVNKFLIILFRRQSYLRGFRRPDRHALAQKCRWAGRGSDIIGRARSRNIMPDNTPFPQELDPVNRADPYPLYARCAKLPSFARTMGPISSARMPKSAASFTTRG